MLIFLSQLTFPRQHQHHNIMDERRYPERQRNPPVLAPGDVLVPLAIRAGRLRVPPPPPAPSANVPSPPVTIAPACPADVPSPLVTLVSASPALPAIVPALLVQSEEERYFVGVSVSFTVVTFKKLIKYAEHLGEPDSDHEAPHQLCFYRSHRRL